MSGPLLCTLSIEGLRPLGSPAQRSFELIQATVAELVDLSHADIFAEPMAARHGNHIDWYATFEGKALAVSCLSEADHKALFALLESRLQVIRGVAGSLAGRKSTDEQRLGEALSNACTYPDAESVFAVRCPDGSLQPVITNWAWTREAPLLVRGVLAGQAPRRESPEGAAAVPARTVAGGNELASRISAAAPATGAYAAGATGGTFWLLLIGWLLLAVLLGIILWLMLAPCALRPVLLGDHCPGVAEAPPDGALADLSLLRVDLARLQTDLNQQELECGRVAELDRAEAWRMAQTPKATVLPDAVADDDGAVLTIAEAPGTDTPTARAATEDEERDLEQRIAERAAAQGKLAFSLGWNSNDDIDLKVQCPSGDIISYQTKNRSVCGGKLDIDANIGSNMSDRPIENIYFDTVEPGQYVVTVKLHIARSGTEQEFSLRAKAADGPVKVVTGSVSPDRREWSWSLEIGE